MIGLMLCGPRAQARPILVFAAASLQPALEEIGKQFEHSTGGEVVISAAGSSALARQIEHGAPADVFVSANAQWVQYLVEKGRISKGEERIIASNRLEVIAPLGANLGGDWIAQIGSERIALANVSSVPAGIYARAALEALGLWTTAAPNVIQTDHVRAALRLVERGEAGLGIVYATDRTGANVELVAPIAPDLHPQIEYMAAPIVGGQNTEATAFLKYLLSSEGQEVFARYGFLPPQAQAPQQAFQSRLSAAEWAALGISLKVAIWACLGALPLAMAAAYALSRGRFRGRQVLNIFVHLPLVLPPVVTGYALLMAFGTQGPVGKVLAAFGLSVAFHWTGAAIAAGVMAFPLMVRAMHLSFDAVDPKLEEAARSLGMGPLRSFWRVTFPLALPGVLVALVMGFAKAIGEFGATITFVSNIPSVTQTLPSAIYSSLQVPDGDGAALRLVMICVVVAIGALVVSEMLSRRVAQWVRRR